MRVILGLMLLCLGAGVARGDQANSQIAVAPDDSLIAVVDPHENVLAIFDAKKQKLQKRVTLTGKPECVSWIGTSKQLAVSLYEEKAIAIVDAATGEIAARIPVGFEPYGIAVEPSGHRLWVTLDFPGEIVEVDCDTRQVARHMHVEQNLRGIALAADGKTLFVTEYYTGRLHAVDLASWKVGSSWEGQPSDNLCRSVVVNSKGTKAYLSHIRSRTHVVHARGAIVPFLGVCDLNESPEVRRRGIALDTYNGVYVTSNAWESAVSPDGKTLATVYAGTDDMNISNLLDDGYREISRKAIVQVGKNPRAVRFSPDGANIYVYEAVDFALSVYDAANLKRVTSMSMGAPTRPADWRRGLELFHSAKPPMSNARWVSCSSCHPDGQADGRTWQNPEGMRRTPSLAGLAHTHPLHWSADRDEVQDFEYTIRGPLMGGAGLFRGKIKPKTGHEAAELDEPLTGKSADLDALAVYANSFGFTLSPFVTGPRQLSPSALRGEKLFDRLDTQCATCHSGPYYTDSRLEKPYNLHDVGTGTEDDKMGPKYDTPTLLGTYRNRRLLHDGRAASLEEVLTKFNVGDRHGKTSQLSSNQLADLVEFLKSLPFEPPPNRTSNTLPGHK